MSRNTKTAVCAALAIAAAASLQPAEAQGAHRYMQLDVGPMSGMVNGILDNALDADRTYYGTGSPHCPWVTTSDGYGRDVGRIRTCRLPPSISNGVIHLHSERLPF
jgi:hypothetical protein